MPRLRRGDAIHEAGEHGPSRPLGFAQYWAHDGGTGGVPDGGGGPVAGLDNHTAIEEFARGARAVAGEDMGLKDDVVGGAVDFDAEDYGEGFHEEDAGGEGVETGGGFRRRVGGDGGQGGGCEGGKRFWGGQG